MRSALLLAAFASLFLVSPAFSARGINLRWDACMADGGVVNKTFACDTNTGSESLFLSVVSDTSIDQVTGFDGTIDFVLMSPYASTNWWQMKNVGTCRRTALSSVFLPGSETPSCANVLGAEAAGGVTSYSPNFTDGRVRLFFTVAVSASSAGTVPANHEAFVIQLRISHVNTVGTGACSGCDTPVCIGAHYLRVSRPVGVDDAWFYTETVPGSASVSWQGGVVDSYIPPQPLGHNDPWPHRTVTCSLPVPALDRTWGSIKSLYR